MRPIVAVLLLLCSANAMAQVAPPSQRQRGNGSESRTFDAHRCLEASLDRHAER